MSIVCLRSAARPLSLWSHNKRWVGIWRWSDWWLLNRHVQSDNMLRCDVCYSVTCYTTQHTVSYTSHLSHTPAGDSDWIFSSVQTVICSPWSLSVEHSWQLSEETEMFSKKSWKAPQSNPQSKFNFQKFQIFLIWNSGIRLKVNNTNMGKTIGYFWWLRLIVIIKIYIIVQVKLNSLRVDPMFVFILNSPR